MFRLVLRPFPAPFVYRNGEGRPGRFHHMQWRQVDRQTDGRQKGGIAQSSLDLRLSSHERKGLVLPRRVVMWVGSSMQLLTDILKNLQSRLNFIALHIATG